MVRKIPLATIGNDVPKKNRTKKKTTNNSQFCCVVNRKLDCLLNMAADHGHGCTQKKQFSGQFRVYVYV